MYKKLLNIFGTLIFCLVFLTASGVIVMGRIENAKKLQSTEPIVQKQLNATQTPTPYKCLIDGNNWDMSNEEECLTSRLKTTQIIQQYYNTHTSNVVTKSTTIDCIGPDGKHLSISQKECDEFNRAWGSNQKTNIVNKANANSTNSSKLVSIPCKTVFSTYTAWGVTLDDANKECGRLQGIDSNGQNQINNMWSTPTSTTYTEPISPSIDYDANASKYGQCKLTADQWYDNQGSAYGGSTKDAMKQLAYPEYQSMLSDCSALYPH